jgi:hypothetical protein
LDELNTPYDLLLRRLIHQGSLRAWAAFPFPTTVRPHLQGSSIQMASDERANVAWDSFRRLMWLHTSEEDASLDAELIAQHFKISLGDHLNGVLQAVSGIPIIPTRGNRIFPTHHRQGGNDGSGSDRPTQEF